MSKGAKAWTKKYRTEIAAPSSSVLSTFAAFPLDFAKSRMHVRGYGDTDHGLDSSLMAGVASYHP